MRTGFGLGEGAGLRQDFNAAGTNTDQNCNKWDIQDMLNSINYINNNIA